MPFPQVSRQQDPELDYSLPIRVKQGRLEAHHPLRMTAEQPGVGMVKQQQRE